MTTTTTTQQTMTTISDIKRANKARDGHWFDAGSMRFFNTCLGRVYPLADGGALFITSERVDATYPRRYSVRRARPDGNISTVCGGFQAYNTAAQAHAAAKSFNV